MGTRSDTANALCVYKEWHELIRPLLWTNIAIRNDNLLQFVHSLTIARAHVGESVRNLSTVINTISRHSKSL